VPKNITTREKEKVLTLSRRTPASLWNGKEKKKKVRFLKRREKEEGLSIVLERTRETCLPGEKGEKRGGGGRRVESQNNKKKKNKKRNFLGAIEPRGKKKKAAFDFFSENPKKKGGPSPSGGEKNREERRKRAPVWDNCEKGGRRLLNSNAQKDALQALREEKKRNSSAHL